MVKRWVGLEQLLQKLTKVCYVCFVQQITVEPRYNKVLFHIR